MNFRDEKTLLGFGEPQVRTEAAVRTTADFFVFVYALLLLALQQCQLAHYAIAASALAASQTETTTTTRLHISGHLPVSCLVVVGGTRPHE